VTTTLRHRVFELLWPAEGRDRASQAVDFFLIGLILIDVACFIAFSSGPVEGTFHAAVETFILVVFTIEYVLRAWVSVEDHEHSGRLGRLHYLRTPLALVDLVAILPIVNLIPFLGLELPEQLTAIRVFRLGKLFRYFDSAVVLGRTIWRIRHELGVISVALVMGLTAAGLLMNGLEGEENPTHFGTVQDAMWWAVVTMTTVGYGDAIPVTGAGRVLASLLMISGIAMFALPAGLLGAAFTREVQIQIERRRARRDARFRREETRREERIEAALEAKICPHCGKALASGSGESSP
jgi:voltage-gated potassium channel